jgi:hypothetical protein
MQVRCAQCGATLSCDPGPRCWCAELPFGRMPAAPSGCLCRACLLRFREEPEVREAPVTR